MDLASSIRKKESTSLPSSSVSCRSGKCASRNFEILKKDTKNTLFLPPSCSDTDSFLAFVSDTPDTNGVSTSASSGSAFAKSATFRLIQEKGRKGKDEKFESGKSLGVLSTLMFFFNKDNERAQLWKKELAMPEGDLECILSGFVSYRDYCYIARVLYKLYVDVSFQKNGGALEEEKSTLEKGSVDNRLNIEMLYNKNNLFSHYENYTEGNRFHYFNHAHNAAHSSNIVWESSLLSATSNQSTDLISDYELMLLDPQKAIYQPDSSLIASRDEAFHKMDNTCAAFFWSKLVAIVVHDNVLEHFFVLLGGYMPRLRLKQQSMSLSSLFSLCVLKTSHLKMNATEGLSAWESIEKLIKHTTTISLAYIEQMAKAMPAGLQWRFMNQYLLPSSPVVSPLSTCGINLGRTKEYFVSIKDRFNFLKKTCDFRSPKEVVQCIATLSNLVSNIISSFTFCATVACATYIAECRSQSSKLAQKAKYASCSSAPSFVSVRIHRSENSLNCSTNCYTQNSDGKPSSRGELQIDHAASVGSEDHVAINNTDVLRHISHLEEFIARFCKQYTERSAFLLNDIRRRYPNIFISSTLNSEGACRPSMLSVVTTMLIKLIFLFAGGIGSISADDCRSPMAELLEMQSSILSGSRIAFNEPENVRTPSTVNDAMPAKPIHRVPFASTFREKEFTDDIVLEQALNISALSHLTLVSKLLGLPEIGATDPAHGMRMAKICAGTWRVMFQYIGVLPFGCACPTDMLEWIKIFPLYAVDDTSKSALLNVHALLAYQHQVPLALSNPESVLQATTLSICKVLGEEVSATENIAPEANIGQKKEEGGEETFFMLNKSNKRLLEWSDFLTGTGILLSSLCGKPQPSYMLHPFFEAYKDHEGDDFYALNRRLFELCAQQCTKPFFQAFDYTPHIQNAVLLGPKYRQQVLDYVFKSLHIQLSSKTVLHTYRQKTMVLISWNLMTGNERGDVNSNGLAEGAQLGTGAQQKRVPRIRAGDELGFTIGGACDGTEKLWLAFSLLTPSRASPMHRPAADATVDDHGRSEKDHTVHEHRYVVLAVFDLSRECLQQALVLDVCEGAWRGDEDLSQMSQGTAREKSSGGLLDVVEENKVICHVVHYRRLVSPLKMGAEGSWAWANPEFCSIGSAAIEREETMNSIAGAAHGRTKLPFMIGFLLGSAMTNGVVFPLPLAPLAFRFLSRAIKFGESFDQMELRFCDISLLSPEFMERFFARLMHNEKAPPRPKAPIPFFVLEGHPHTASWTGSTSGAQSSSLHCTVQAIVEEIILGTNSGRKKSLCFWNEILRGLRCNSLAMTPLFTNCCARTLRRVLCGQVDSSTDGFSFCRQYAFLFNRCVVQRPYGIFMCKATMECFDQAFDNTEKRKLVHFITGYKLQPLLPKSEAIRICFDTDALGRLPEECDTLLLTLPTSQTWSNTLKIPNYMDFLLMRKTAPCVQLMTERKNHRGCSAAMHLTLDDLAHAWWMLSAREQNALINSYKTLLVEALRKAMIGSDKRLEKDGNNFGEGTSQRKDIGILQPWLSEAENAEDCIPDLFSLLICYSNVVESLTQPGISTCTTQCSKNSSTPNNPTVNTLGQKCAVHSCNALSSAHRISFLPNLTTHKTEKPMSHGSIIANDDILEWFSMPRVPITTAPRKVPLLSQGKLQLLLVNKQKKESPPQHKSEKFLVPVNSDIGDVSLYK